MGLSRVVAVVPSSFRLSIHRSFLLALLARAPCPALALRSLLAPSSPSLYERTALSFFWKDTTAVLLYFCLQPCSASWSLSFLLRLCFCIPPSSAYSLTRSLSDTRTSLALFLCFLIHSLIHSLCLSIPLQICLCFRPPSSSRSVSLSLCLLSFSHTLSVSFTLTLSLPPLALSPSLPVSPRLSLSLPVSPCLSPSRLLSSSV